MAEYMKPWLPVDEQIKRLAGHGIEVGNPDRAASILAAIGYYRLTGYLYPFRRAEKYIDDEGKSRTRVLSLDPPTGDVVGGWISEAALSGILA